MKVGELIAQLETFHWDSEVRISMPDGMWEVDWIEGYYSEVHLNAK